MNGNDNPIPFGQGRISDDPLTEIARDGARRMLAAALTTEADDFVAALSAERLSDGRRRVVRHGAGPERLVQTGIGPLEVRRPKVRDRCGDGSERIRFSSAILPRWARRSPSLDALLPVLYLRGGFSTGDFQEALEAILGPEAPNLSHGVISRLTGEWDKEHDAWQRRDLSMREYAYIWADGVYLQARMEPAAECMLVVIGATPEGRKELVGFQVGVRESAQSWRELLRDLRSRGLCRAPRLAVGDGGLGFWKACEELYPETLHQRCWVHKTANVLNKFPKSMGPGVKADIHDIQQSPSRAEAENALDRFSVKYGDRHDKAVACLEKDRDALLAFQSFPAKHWKHLRTTNPVESLFSSVRHRTVRTRGCLSQRTAKLMVFKLARVAERRWCSLDGCSLLPNVIRGVTFRDGLEVAEQEALESERRAA